MDNRESEVRAGCPAAFRDYPFPCSAKVSASEANPQYPMDTTIDIEVCQGCMYNKTDMVGAVDCSFPDIAKKGGSDPLPPEFALPESDGSATREVEEGSGFRTEDGHEVNLLPNTQHPPGNKNSSFYRFKNMVNLSSGYWKEDSLKTAADTRHTVSVSVPSHSFDRKPIDGLDRIIETVTEMMTMNFGNVDVSASEGTWLDKGENHHDDKTKVSSDVEDLDSAKEFITELARSLEETANNQSIEFHIDGEPFYTGRPDSGEEREEEWNPQNEIEIIGANIPSVRQEIIDMLTEEFGGTGAQSINEEGQETKQIVSYFDDDDIQKAYNIFDLLDARDIDTTDIEVAINGSSIVA